MWLSPSSHSAQEESLSLGESGNKDDVVVIILLLKIYTIHNKKCMTSIIKTLQLHYKTIQCNLHNHA